MDTEMMKEEYVKAEMELVEFESEDAITSFNDLPILLEV